MSFPRTCASESWFGPSEWLWAHGMRPESAGSVVGPYGGSIGHGLRSFSDMARFDALIARTESASGSTVFLVYLHTCSAPDGQCLCSKATRFCHVGFRARHLGIPTYITKSARGAQTPETSILFVDRWRSPRTGPIQLKMSIAILNFGK